MIAVVVVTVVVVIVVVVAVLLMVLVLVAVVGEEVVIVAVILFNGRFRGCDVVKDGCAVKGSANQLVRGFRTEGLEDVGRDGPWLLRVGSGVQSMVVRVLRGGRRRWCAVGMGGCWVRRACGCKRESGRLPRCCRSISGEAWREFGRVRCGRFDAGGPPQAGRASFAS